MWRAAAEDKSPVFGDNPGADVATEYGCIFGISEPTNDLREGMIRQVHAEGSCLGIIVGRDNVVYWFHFFKMPETHLGLDLPRFTKEFEAEITDKQRHRSIVPGTTWGELYDRKRISIITPLPNHRFSRWHYKRIICIGDAVCKSQPIAGQGGCSALESSVALVDHIHAALQANDMKTLSDEQVDAAFTKLTEIRLKRTTSVVDEGLQYMKLASWSNALLRVVDKHLVWLIPKNTLVDLMFAGAAGSYHSNTLPQPVRRFATGTGDPLPAAETAA